MKFGRIELKKQVGKGSTLIKVFFVSFGILNIVEKDYFSGVTFLLIGIVYTVYDILSYYKKKSLK